MSRWTEMSHVIEFPSSCVQSSRAPHITSHQKLSFNFLGHGQSLPSRSLVSRRGIAEETVRDTGLRGVRRNPILGGILSARKKRSALCIASGVNSFLSQIGFGRRTPRSAACFSPGTPDRYVRLGFSPEPK